MRKALITGADGFLGRHLTEKLLNEGNEVFAVFYRRSEAPLTNRSDRLHIRSVDLTAARRHVAAFPAGKST